jgi:Amt family ammonium transporter
MAILDGLANHHTAKPRRPPIYSSQLAQFCITFDFICLRIHNLGGFYAYFCGTYVHYAAILGIYMFTLPYLGSGCPQAGGTFLITLSPGKSIQLSTKRALRPHPSVWIGCLAALAVTFLSGGLCNAAALPRSPLPRVQIDTGSTAWMMASTALVMFMIPGLALFYAGMVRKKNILATMMHSYSALVLVILQWIFFGYMLGFGTDHGGIIGWNPADILLLGVGPHHAVSQSGHYIPETVFCMFQAMFAMITPAVIAGSIVERMKFSSFLVFVLLWTTFVYDPLVHWVWGGGWLNQLHVADFAGGTVVEIASGVGGLMLSILIGGRKGYPNQVLQPSSLALTLLGAGILWFGWYGFNAGSAGAADGLAGIAFLNTTVAAAAAGFAWNMAEYVHHRRMSTLGLASGIVAGLVAITPGCGFVAIWASPIIGILAGAACYLAVQIKAKMGYDDSLDAFGVHGVGGFLGMLLTGLFAIAAVNGVRGLLQGDVHQFLIQLVAAVSTVLFVAVGTLAVGWIVKVTMGLRVPDVVEVEGLDLGIHGETAWDIGTLPEAAIVAPADS